MGYYRKTGRKLIKQNKKDNYKIFECYTYNAIEGYNYYYVVMNYNCDENIGDYTTIELLQYDMMKRGIKVCV